MLKEGSKAPAFSLMDDYGNRINLSDYAGKKTVVLWRFQREEPVWEDLSRDRTHDL
jgi:peroxiredoxin